MSDSTRRLRLGIIGAGNIVRSRHLPNLRRLPEVEIVAVCNRRPESARCVAEEWGIPEMVERWQDLVARDDIDAVLIGAPPYLHHDATIAALEAGKHVFCQARMAMTFVEAVRMEEAARRAAARGLKAMICPAPHCLPGDAVVRRLIREGFLGQVTGVLVSVADNRYLDPDRPLHWRQMWHISGCNTLQLGMMVEVLHRWLGAFRRVTALAATYTRERPVEGGRLARVDRPDAVAIAAELTGGGLAILHFSGVVRPYANFVELHGTRGSLRYDVDSDELFACRDGSWEPVPIPEHERTPWTAEADFVRSILEDRPIPYPNPTFADGLRYMEFTEAVFRSVEQGVTVNLPLPR